VSTLGRSLVWTMQGAARRRVSTRTVQVTVTPRNGRTTIRMEEPLGQLAGGLFGGLVGGLGGGTSGISMGIGMGVFHSALVATGLIGGMVAGSYLLARTIFGRMVRERGERMQQLMSRLAEHVSATAVRTPELSRPAERPALDRGS
jgi:eukaryotic-like serine/threonine-protein kinase